MSDSTPTFDDRTALVVVDVQNDFAHPDGNLYVDGGDRTIPVINELVERASEKGAFVVYTQDWHPAKTPHFVTGGGTWPVHCVRDTWGAELHRDLVVAGPVVRKGTGGEDGYSGFSVRDVETDQEQPTELGELLAGRGTERVVVVGLAEDVCVSATALDAQRLGYQTVVHGPATRPVEATPGDGERARAELREAGVTVTS